MPTAILTLKEGRERSLLRRHPWLFSGAIHRVEGDPAPGATVEIRSAAGEFLAWAAYSPQSQIRARVWSFDREQPIDAGFLRARLAAAISARQPYRETTNALRLVHAESDGLPGLVVDQYAGALVVQFLSAGAEFWRETIVGLLPKLVECEEIYERSDSEVRALEGLPARTGRLFPLDRESENSHQQVEIHEHGLKFTVDIADGHKTGFYLDQRANRLRARELAPGREVLDCFSYSGGFALNALRGGAASATLIESSAEALELARANLALNDVPADKVEFLNGDAFERLRTMRDSRRAFDMIILDPPKFAPTRAHAEAAARAYKDINLLAFKLLKPGGLLLTFSCSGGVDAALFQKIVAGAALDAGADARILARLNQGSDHPVALHFPEGDYLKGLLCQV